jgi:hypothetical protein
MVVRAVCSSGSNTETAVWVGRSWVVGASTAKGCWPSSMWVSPSSYWGGFGVEYWVLLVSTGMVISRKHVCATDMSGKAKVQVSPIG